MFQQKSVRYSGLFQSGLILTVAALLLSGCVSSRHSAQSLNDVRQTRAELSRDPGQITRVDKRGRNLIHLAVLHDPSEIGKLAEVGVDINGLDKSGMTPLHLAITRNPNAIMPLLVAGARRDIPSSRRVRCSRTVQYENITANRMAELCSKRARKVFEYFDRISPHWQQAEAANTEAGYQSFRLRFPKTLYTSTAIQRESAFRQERLLLAQGECRMALGDWFFTEGECPGPDKLAQGKGVAESSDGTRLEGQFSDGRMTQGKLFAAGQMVYDGVFENGIPHGEGICLYEGSLEECRYYEGQRVDTLFRQRQEMASQLANMERRMVMINRSDDASSSRLGYLADLNSKYKGKKTAAQIQAVLDLFNVMARLARKDRD
ncbi:MAG: hypothetical protein CMI09_11435 [Oceanospirillaceae bacterium]|nr:hypothetical protein [Oceanospirillaceae bacterium]